MSNKSKTVIQKKRTLFTRSNRKKCKEIGLFFFLLFKLRKYFLYTRKGQIRKETLEHKATIVP